MYRRNTMKKTSTSSFFLLLSFCLLINANSFSQVLFTENFESGTPSLQWGYYPNPSTGLPEETVVAVPMSSAPVALPNGGNYVGHLQDLDGSYTGSAVALAGNMSLKNYSIEGDVYCYVGAAPSAYTGLVVYADTTQRDFYKLRADFDASDRINFSGRRTDPNTFLPLFNKDFRGVDNPGLFPTVSGWHKMKIEVRETSPNETSFWCYFDGQLLAGCPITDTSSNRVKAGYFGLYSFQQGPTGLAAYFDNIVVTAIDSTTSIDNNFNSVPGDFALFQNYPNPFNPETEISYNLPSGDFIQLTVHDLLGRKVKTLVSEFQQSGKYSVKWDGKDEEGRSLVSGIYLYSLKSTSFTASKKMMLLK